MVKEGNILEKYELFSTEVDKFNQMMKGANEEKDAIEKQKKLKSVRKQFESLKNLERENELISLTSIQDVEASIEKIQEELNELIYEYESQALRSIVKSSVKKIKFANGIVNYTAQIYLDNDSQESAIFDTSSKAKKWLRDKKSYYAKNKFK